MSLSKKIFPEDYEEVSVASTQSLHNNIVQRERIAQALIMTASGLTEKLVATTNLSLHNFVSNINFAYVRDSLNTVDSTTEKLMVGGHLFEQLNHALSFGNHHLKDIVIHNFSVQDLLLSHNSIRQSLDHRVTTLQMAKAASVEVQEVDNYDRLPALAHYEIYRRRKDLMDRARAEWEATQGSNNSSGSTKAASKSASAMPYNLRPNQHREGMEQSATAASNAGVAGTDAAAAFEESDYYLAAQQESSTLDKEYEFILTNLRNHYFDQQNLKKTHDAQRRALEQELIQVSKQLEGEGILVIYLSGVESALEAIMSKLRTALNQPVYAEIRARLTARTIFLADNIAVANPLGEGHLATIYQILAKYYLKPTLPGFIRQLLKVLQTSFSEQDTKQNPRKAITEADATIALWNRMNIWAYMDFDKLMAISLVRSWHERTDLRVKASNMIIEFANEIEAELAKDPSNPTYAPGNMPLYTRMVSWFTDSYEQAQIVRHMKQDSGQPAAQPYSPAGSTYGKQQQPGTKGGSNTSGQSAPQSSLAPAAKAQSTTMTGRVGGAEQAAAATTPASTEAAWWTKCQPVTGMYNSDVTRAFQLYVVSSDTGKYYPYTATDTACPVCNRKPPSNGKRESCVTNAARCFGGQCMNCMKYGHKAANCHQYVVSKESAACAATSPYELPN
jgi:hypothetical protein